MTNFLPKFADNVRLVPDFPKPGILFKDITPVLGNAELFKQTIDWLVNAVASVEGKPNMIAGIDARGFILGAAVADRMGIGFVPIRKPGKLPAKTFSAEYELEYGTGTLEIHEDAFKPGSKVVIIDDLLATGGTAEAAATLVEKCQASIHSFVFLIELSFLKGKEKLIKFKAPVFSLQADED